MGINSIISLDLGGKNTGYFSFTTNDFNNIKEFQSGTIIYDNSFVISQVDRRSKRHAKRNLLRRKYAKRLFLLILKEYYKYELDYLPDEILGLFNRRGYTYAGFELDDEKREKLESDVLRDFLDERFKDFKIEKNLEIENFLNQIASKEENFNSFKESFGNFFKENTYKTETGAQLNKDIKDSFENKNDVKKLLEALKVINHCIDEFDKQQNQRNLHRTKYFKELKECIEQNAEIKNFFNRKIDLEKAYYLIANISNFQLKELRRYFNDEEMKLGDIWDEEKLKKIVYRFISSWHPKGDEKLKTLQDNLRKDLNSKNIIDFLTTTNPDETIPPYDDMNNRGAVKCQTLRLNEDYLNKHLSNWKKITDKLALEFHKENLKDCTNEKNFLEQAVAEQATLFHRILDTPKKIDLYKLREGKEKHYIDILGKDDAIKFRDFTEKYYEIINKKVRTGIWQESDNIFKKCKQNPPYKNNQIHNLVSEILGVKISEESFKEFENTIWKEKFGNKKLSTYCKNIEELRKQKGNLFKTYKEELKKEELKGIENLDEEQKKHKKLLEEKQLDFWTNKIAEFFKIDNRLKTRFQNHFSMAQLYTIIETRRSGFNSTCKQCSEENRFRSSTNTDNFTVYDKETGEQIKDLEFDKEKHIKVYENSNAQRLPADTQRPFSGKIERYIDKLAYEIVKIKSKELENILDSNIKMKIILEQNKFEYEVSIIDAKIKKVKKKEEDASKKRIEDYKKSLKSKSKRIKDLYENCLYCGMPLGNDGEIDHILPRSRTLKIYKTVFNSEGNLLYVHQKCNQAKKDKIYTIDDIKVTINIREIEKEIEEIKSYKTFSGLTQSQQKAFKCALFLPDDNEAYKKVVNWLRTDQSSMVNGTQKYLAKKIQEKLIKIFEERFEFEFILADSEDVSRLREYYAKQNTLLAKPKEQSPSSHTIDAIVALSSVHKKLDIEQQLSTEDILKFVQINNTFTKSLSKIEKEKRENLGNASIFKDSIYQENFSPIYQYDGKFYTGFVKAGKVPDFEHSVKIDKIKYKYCVEIKKDDFDQIKDYFKNSIKKENGLIVYQIDKQKVLTLFHDISNNNSDNLKLAKTLDKFSYNLIKESVNKAPKILKENKTTTKVYEKNIVLPIYDEWKRFDDFFKKELKEENIEYKEKDGQYQIDNDVFINICKKYFKAKNQLNKNELNRKKAKRVFSLPIVQSPSGGFRIKRKNHKNENIYQLVGIDGAKSAGFAVEDDKINTSKDVLLPTLTKSKNVSFKEPAKKELLEYIDMNNFRDLSAFVNLKNIKIFISPASSNRPLVRVELDLEDFKKIIKNNSLNFLELLDNIKLEKEQRDEFDNIFSSCNFAPRDDKIKILKADINKIFIEFSNNNKTIMKYYDQAPNIDFK